MKSKILLFLLFLSAPSISFGQTLPNNRSIDWTLAGLRDTTTASFTSLDLQNYGILGDSLTPNDTALSQVINSLNGSPTILIFPAGNFVFNQTIELTTNIILRGQGANNTNLILNLGGNGHGIKASGSTTINDTSSFINSGIKDSNYINVQNTSLFMNEDWVKIIQNDSDLVTSSWANNTVGQILKIKEINGNKITFDSPLRINFDLSRNPYLVKITPLKNIGIECLSINRIDNTAPEQSSNIYFNYIVNSWVNGIASKNCTFSHVKAENSANLQISTSYFHHAFDYGGGGRAYGVTLQTTTNECLVENNIFEHLRHSMIVQSGANGNVFAYNYSFDPYWVSPSLPSDAAGDLVLHGNYVFANLFEQNICMNIVIDDSHGPNGPNNTMFRNRAEGYGIFFSASNSPNQNLIGNDIPNTNFPYSLVNYNILGANHFTYGNNNKGTITPSGTNALPEISYAYDNKPSYISNSQWGAIGTPNNMGSGTISAKQRYIANNIFANTCGNTPLETLQNNFNNINIYPNPIKDSFTIEHEILIKELSIHDLYGRKVFNTLANTLSYKVNTDLWNKGIYFIIIKDTNNISSIKKLIKL